MTIDELTEEDLDFACSCGESKATCDLVRAWAEEKLGFAKWQARWPRPDFSTAVINDLHWSYWAGIDDVGYDHWGGTSASTYQPEKDKEPEFGCFVMWDAWEDGLAFILRRFYLRYGDKRERP